MRERNRRGRWHNRFQLYIRARSKNQFNQFLNITENEGKGTSNVILDLIEEYVEKHSTKQLNKAETIGEEPENLERG